jgi:hypothetical protein
MDVYGKEPTAEVGKYFRRNAWGWRPLATLCTTLCPKETQGCIHWQSNDGDGLDATGAKALAAALQDKINQGAVKAYIEIRNAELSAMPHEPCRFCEGSGIRRDAVGVGMKQPDRKVPDSAEWRGGKHPRAGQMGWCNGCDGRGFDRPFRLLVFGR